jgi:hypothetical protein
MRIPLRTQPGQSSPAFAEETRDPALLRLALPVYGLYRKLTKRR